MQQQYPEKCEKNSAILRNGWSTMAGAQCATDKSNQKEKMNT